MRFAVAKFQHETCTFCPGGDVEVADWMQYSEPLSGEALLASGSYIRGFAKQAREFGDVELVPLTSPVGVFGGSSRSWNTKETFDHFVDQMIAELEARMPVDAVYLALHGAMAVRDVPRPEAEIARRFRLLVRALGNGWRLPGTQLQLPGGDPERGAPDPPFRRTHGLSALQHLCECLGHGVARHLPVAREGEDGPPQLRRLLLEHAPQLRTGLHPFGRIGHVTLQG